jgi:hypothetical protein
MASQERIHLPSIYHQHRRCHCGEGGINN